MSAAAPKRFRLLMLCYPGDYRRERGREIVDTFLDAGVAWSSPRVALNVVRHGMRCRLGRPASRGVVVWAALASVVCGLFGAAIATRLAWESARPLPTQAQANQILGPVLPGHGISGGDDSRIRPMFDMYGLPLGLHNVDWLLREGGEYGLGSVGVDRHGQPPVDQSQTLATALQRLRDNGWSVAGPYVGNWVECGGPGCDEATLPKQTTLFAKRGDDILEINLVAPIEFAQDTYLTASVSRATPWPVYPAGAVGGLIGLMLGWLLFGWVSRRTMRRPASLFFTAVLYTLAMFLWCGPIVIAVPWQIFVHLRQPPTRWAPLWEWLGQPTGILPFLAGCTAAVLALAVGALPRRAVVHLRPVPRG